MRIRWEIAGIPRVSWGFLVIPGDFREYLRILRSEDHVTPQDS